MKIAIINDTHFGSRNDSPFFLENSLVFFEKTFFPYIRDNDIKTVIHLGDLLDRRKFINFNTLSQVRKRFFEPFKNNEIDLYITIGNHDTYYKNTNSLNSLSELFRDRSSNVTIIENPTKLVFDGLCIGMIPWISKENEDQCFQFMSKCDCPFIMGHFEIMGFQVMNGVIHPHGISSEIFKRFESVLSGHFHIKQSNGNIHYLGTQYELNFGDVNSLKGFHVLDTETRELEFIPNPKRIFHVIKYDDEKELDAIKNLKFSTFKQCFIKVIVVNKTKPLEFEKFIDALYLASPQDISIIEDYQEKQTDTSVDITEDTLSIINKEIDGLEKIQDKSKLKVIIKDLYMESLTL